MARKLWSMLLALSMLLGLAACGGSEAPADEGKGQEKEEPFVVRAMICDRQRTLDPAHMEDVGGETIVAHLFENLLRWEPDEEGEMVLVPGQAESYSVEESHDGTITYTFTLREDLKWSDGRDLTAGDFLYTWRRLFDKKNIAKGITGLFTLRGYSEAFNSGDVSHLGVSAPDRRTFVITLDRPCAYFLEEFCAGAMTMPVPKREAKRNDWGTNPDRLVCNGPYKLEELDDRYAVLVENEEYYDTRKSSPERLEFYWKEAYEGDGGDLHLLTDLEGKQIAEGEKRCILPVLKTYTLLLNNEAEPFDNEFVRQAMAAAIDREALLAAIGSPTLAAATGIVPSGVRERGALPEEEKEEPEEPVGLPSANPVEEEKEEEKPIWDFRSVGDAQHQAVSEEPLLPEEKQELARQLLAQAGYPDGKGFPEVEYLYLSTVPNRLAALELQTQWKAVLNIDIAVRGLEEDELRSLLLEGAYACASFSITSTWNDATFFLNRWMTGKSGNLIRNNNRGFDLLNEIAGMTVDTAAREAYLHDAEEILLQSCGVVPLYFFGRSYSLSEELTGLGVLSTELFFLRYLERLPRFP